MNYMEKVAQMLGVELGEEFKLEGENHFHRLSLNGVEWCSLCDKTWEDDERMLYRILTGKVEIIKQPWKPQKNDEYYFISLFDGEVSNDTWTDHPADMIRYKVGNVFRTEIEAEKNIKAYKKYIAQEPDCSWRVKDDNTANTNSN